MGITFPPPMHGGKALAAWEGSPSWASRRQGHWMHVKQILPTQVAGMSRVSIHLNTRERAETLSLTLECPYLKHNRAHEKPLSFQVSSSEKPNYMNCVNPASEFSLLGF